MAKTQKTQTDKTEIENPTAATAEADTVTVVDATADTAPAAVAAPPPAAPEVDAPPAASDAPIAAPQVAPAAAVVEDAAPEAITDTPPAAVPTVPLPACCTCGRGVEIDDGFATEGSFMAVTTKTMVEFVHSSNHVSRPIRNFHFRCAAELITKAVKDSRAL